MPVHQRPPQFDYIYRSNERAKSRAAAEAAELKGKLDQLASRRQRLEAEQAGLWVEIAFRAIGHYDLDKKALYRFEPLLLASDTDSRNMAEAMKATSIFMAVALSIITEVDRNQAGTFIRIKPLLTEARQELNDSYLRLALNVTDRKTSLGRFAALAKRLEDVAANLTDSYVVAMEGDSAKDQQRKETFRMQLQQSLLGYAQIVLAMDEMASDLKDQYAYKPDVDKPIKFVGLKSIEPEVSNAKPVNANRANNHPIVGTWVELRPGTPAGDRIRIFKEDGSFVLTTPKNGKTEYGTWRQEASRIYFSQKDQFGVGVDDKWFSIVKHGVNSISISMEGQRAYDWIRKESGTKADATTLAK